ncbi:hypothetical protein NA78x_003683 [Anatilimnocola sp. NA78]|uniref:hypothetical protein n=1 Tax=Anatilimnocola sp. NA78 TaxID=3415683 RepID=UPI003CE4A2E7
MPSSLCRFVLGCLLVASCATLGSNPAQAEPRTRDDLLNLSPEEKNSLLQKKERFEAMSAEEQERLRKLNAEIVTANNSQQLLTTLDRYHEWLKTLTTKQRADLLELSGDEQIERIKELKRQQEHSRLRDLGGRQLPEGDIDAIFTWLEEFMKQHEDQYLEKLPKEFADRLRSQDEAARRRSLMRGIIMRGPRSDFPMPIREDLERLLPALSKVTRDSFESFKTPEEKQQLARQWIFNAMASKVLPQVSDDDLRKIFKELPPDQQERLERKTPEEMKRELTWRFHWQQWPGREGWRGGPGGGFRPGGGPGGPGGPGSGGPGGPGSVGSGGPGSDKGGPERGPDRGERDRSGSGRGGPGRGGFEPRGPGGERPGGDRPPPPPASPSSGSPDAPAAKQ